MAGNNPCALTNFTPGFILYIMSALRQIRTRSYWMHLAVILPLLYIYQIIPHDHSDSGHEHHHATPIQHANHSHPAVDHDDYESELPAPAHHHDLAQHLDPHFLRILSQGLRFAVDVDFYAALPFSAHEDEPTKAVWTDPHSLLLESVLIASLHSRAPPSHS